MKANQFFRLLPALCSAALTLLLSFASCEGDDTYVIDPQGAPILSADSYTFDAQGPESFRVEVEVAAGTTWTAEPEHDWIKLFDRSDDGVTLTVEAYDGAYPRTGKVVFTAGDKSRIFTVEQLAPVYAGSLRILTDLAYPVISKGGKFVAGLRIEDAGDGASRYAPVVICTSTGERSDLEWVDGLTRMNAVSDDGRSLAVECNSNGCILRDGSLLDFETDGYTYLKIEDISSDGTVWVGSGTNPTTKKGQPLRWTNGEMEELPLPETNGLGQSIRSNVVAYGCSADGSVIYGSVIDYFEMVCWKDGEVFFVGEDVVNIHVEMIMGQIPYTLYDRPYGTRQNYRMSPSGRYLVGIYRAETYTEGDMRPASVDYPFVTDLESGESRMLFEYANHAAVSVTDDGLIHCGTPSNGLKDGLAWMPGSETLVPLDAWFASEYGVRISANRCVCGTSPDGNVIFGMEQTNSGGYRFWYYLVSR